MKKALLIAGACCLAVCLFSGIMYLLLSGVLSRTNAPVSDPPEESDVNSDIHTTSSSETDFTTQTESPYVSPIDFDELQSINPDICAWLEIPGTEMNYPILFREDDNSFYLDHDYKGSYSPAGAIFIEDYNSVDFRDPVTIIYGHNMYTMSAEMFGSLQNLYSNGEWFSQNPDIYVYTPDRTIKYTVFAATPYSNRHILYYNDFSDERQFTSFFDDIFSTRSLSANFNKDEAPEPGDSVIILSTCMKGAEDQRYLVMAKESDKPDTN